MNAANVGSFLSSAGPSTAFLVVIGVLLKVYVSAERRAQRLAKQLDALVEQHEVERAKRWKAEDTAAKARRKAGDLDG